MENKDKVYVESMVNHSVSVLIPNTNIQKTWKKKGAKLSFDRETLVEAYYDPGIEYMFTHGILYTDDMDFKKAVGLEPEDATEPVNVVKMEDSYMKRLIGLMPLYQFKEEIEKLSYDQRQMLVQYAADHVEELKLDRVPIIDEKCGVHLMKSIELKRQAEEE